MWFAWSCTGHDLLPKLELASPRPSWIHCLFSFYHPWILLLRSCQPVASSTPTLQLHLALFWIWKGSQLLLNVRNYENVGIFFKSTDSRKENACGNSDGKFRASYGLTYFIIKWIDSEYILKIIFHLKLPRLVPLPMSFPLPGLRFHRLPESPDVSTRGTRANSSVY